MNLFRNRGRIAGLLYLLVVLIAPLRLVVIPGKLFVYGNAEATAENIAAHEALFRLGIAGDLVTGALMVLVSVALYRLFAQQNKRQGMLMVLFGGPITASLYLLNVLNDAVVLALIHSDDYLSVFTTPQRHALAYLFVRMHSYEITAAELVWGLWLLPLAVLIYQTRLVPRFFAYWLTANGVAYMVLCFTGFLAPQYSERISPICAPLQFGELAFMLWLVIRGVPERPMPRTK